MFLCMKHLCQFGFCHTKQAACSKASKGVIEESLTKEPFAKVQVEKWGSQANNRHYTLRPKGGHCFLDLARLQFKETTRRFIPSSVSSPFLPIPISNKFHKFLIYPSCDLILQSLADTCLFLCPSFYTNYNIVWLLFGSLDKISQEITTYQFNHIYMNI